MTKAAKPIPVVRNCDEALAHWVATFRETVGREPSADAVLEMHRIVHRQFARLNGESVA